MLNTLLPSQNIQKLENAPFAALLNWRGGGVIGIKYTYIQPVVGGAFFGGGFPLFRCFRGPWVDFENLRH